MDILPCIFLLELFSFMVSMICFYRELLKGSEFNRSPVGAICHKLRKREM